MKTTLPVLHESRPDEIIQWCRHILSQPAEQAADLAEPLHRVRNELTGETEDAYETVLRWAVFHEQPVQTNQLRMWRVGGQIMPKRKT